MADCPKCGGYMEELEDSSACMDCEYTESNAVAVGKKTSTVKAKPSKKKAPIVEAEVAKVSNLPDLKATRIDTIPGMIKSRPRVVIYGWRVGVRGFRFGIKQPAHSPACWKEDMTGVQAHHFLTCIKRKNKFGRLEAKRLPIK